MSDKEKKFEVGIYTLADLGPDPLTGKTISPAQRMEEIIEAAKLADEAGLDVFGIGEHHRLDYVVSSPAVVLAAIARETENIRLTSAASLVGTLDPVRLFEDFATLDIVSGGRAEIMAGRGAFTESFPLFGYKLDDYDALFEEHMELLMKLNREEVVTWEGKFRPSLDEAEIAPRPVQEQIPVWIGVGGTLESAARAGRLGAGMALAILSGNPKNFKPLIEHYYEAGKKAGHPPELLKLAITGHAYLAETMDQADEFYPYYSNYKYYFNRKRGFGRKIAREEFEELIGPDTALFVGSPEDVAEKIIRQHEIFGHTRFLAQLDIGGLPFEKVAQSIELLATKVVPILKDAIR